MRKMNLWLKFDLMGTSHLLDRTKRLKKAVIYHHHSSMLQQIPDTRRSAPEAWQAVAFWIK